MSHGASHARKRAVARNLSVSEGRCDTTNVLSVSLRIESEEPGGRCVSERRCIVVERGVRDAIDSALKNSSQPVLDVDAAQAGHVVLLTYADASCQRLIDACAKSEVPKASELDLNLTCGLMSCVGEDRGDCL